MKRPTKDTLICTIDEVERVIALVVHDWQDVPAEVRDILNVHARAPLLSLLIQYQLRGGWRSASLDPRLIPRPPSR
jgi:hypothetical protein